MWWLRSDDDWRRRRDYCEDQKTRNFSDIDTTFVLIKLHWRRSISMKLKWSWGSVGSKKKGRFEIQFVSIPCDALYLLHFNLSTFFFCHFYLLVTSTNSEMPRRHENLFFCLNELFYSYTSCVSSFIASSILSFSLGRFFKAFAFFHLLVISS